MADPAGRATSDPSLFLSHFTRGKEYYDARQYGPAQGQLEEAYLLRPRDPRVLNLLGLVYFKQEKFDKAEEIYRKLLAESGDAHTLWYNLGLICFKLERWEEAEHSFLKALERGGDNPRISFYLGSIYERLHRFQDAIYQYRQAGASLMVRRVEGKIDGRSPIRGVDDTAEFRAEEVRSALRSADAAREALAAAAPRPLQPVGDAVLAPSSPQRRPSDTNRFVLPPGAGETIPPTPPLPPVTPGEIFRLVRHNLMEAVFSGRVFIKQGTVYTYSGHLTFWVKEPRAGGRAPLVIVTGKGRLLLADGERAVTFQRVQGEPVFVEPDHLLACEETLTPRYVAMGGGLDMVALEGTGTIALSIATRPFPIDVTAELPASVPAPSVISWTGALTAKLVEDKQVYEALRGDASGDTLLRLEGTGRVLVEEGGS